MQINVNSQLANSVEYDAQNESLTILFVSGGCYEYSPVSASEVESMKNVHSFGQYFHAHIKNNKSVNRIS